MCKRLYKHRTKKIPLSLCIYSVRVNHQVTDRWIQRWIHIGRRVNPVLECGKYYPDYIMIYFILFYFVRRRGFMAK